MRNVLPLAGCAVLFFSASARAEPAPFGPPPGVKDESGANAASAPAKPEKPAAEPYVNPFQLRGVNPATIVRLDTTVSPFTDPKTKASQIETVSLLSGSLRLGDHYALSTRMGVVRNDHPTSASGSNNASGLTNLTLGGMYGTSFASYWRFSGTVGVGLPVGSGGGNNPDPDVAAAMKAASLARSAMDNTMFGVNDLGFPVGVDLAYTRRGFTAQGELSVISSARVRGEEKSPDKSKVNATGALFVGYFVLPRRLSLGAELHYQRFLSTPDAVAKDPSARDNLTTSGGVRGYFQVASNVQFRPGLSVGTGISGSIADRRYEMVQVDFPIAF